MGYSELVASDYADGAKITKFKKEQEAKKDDLSPKELYKAACGKQEIKHLDPSEPLQFIDPETSQKITADGLDWREQAGKRLTRKLWSDDFEAERLSAYARRRIDLDVANILSGHAAPTLAENKHATQALIDAGYSRHLAVTLVLELLAAMDADTAGSKANTSINGDPSKPSSRKGRINA
ncbi:MAG: hypothetical protein U5K75_08960 [Ahrensia sp.]|nr:hypothetical protein [Ahrensia sp.]